VTRLVLHHTTGTFTSAATVRSIQAFHQGPERGWADIGYNFLVAPTGAIYEGRGWGYTGAHARGHNSTSIGVAYIGDGRQSVSEAAKRSILLLAGEAERRFGRLDRVGHRDVGSTVCPGDVLYQWWMAAPREVAPKPVVEPADPDGWGNRPSWVPKAAWQSMVDWRRSR
jgi:N-acetylmuramoyl-L-alanine amidase